MSDNLLGIKLSEKQFMEDVEKCKKIVDCGVEDYFILYDNKVSINTKVVHGTLLSDIEAVFGPSAVDYFRVAEYCHWIKDVESTENPEAEKVFTMRVRHLTNGDKRKLRNSIRFFPKNSYIVEWIDSTGSGFNIPFVQKADGGIVFLSSLKTLSKSGKTFDWEKSYPYHRLEEFISRIPDYFDSNAAVFNYKGVDCIIPLKKGTAKYTFKNREKVDGIKQRIIHDVKSHRRINLKNTEAVEHHIRGTGLITINGINITLFATLDQAVTITRKEAKKK